MFKALRILLLLTVLLAVAASTLLARWRAQDWSRPQVLTLYPINADGGADTAAYLDGLDERAFADLAPFFQGEAARHGLVAGAAGAAGTRTEATGEQTARPVIRVALGRRIATPPPPVPQDGAMLSAIRWSLQMRWWAWRHTPPSAPLPDVRLYLLFHAPDHAGALPHSTGLPQGRLGVVHVFASRAQQGPNQVVIAHEALHTWGATDKYHPATLQPRFPDGYADPQQEPLLPQRRAELMGGRVPVSPTEARIPAGLGQVVIGEQTAREIGWLKAPGSRP